MAILDRYDRSVRPVNGTNVKFSCSCFNSFFIWLLKRQSFYLIYFYKDASRQNMFLIAILITLGNLEYLKCRKH